MKHDAFDEALRRRAQREKSALSTQAEERVARAIRAGQARAASHARAQGERATAACVWPGEERQAPHKPRRRITRLIPLITGAAACLTAAALWAARTPVDRVHESASDTGLSTHNAAFETVLPLADGTDGASALAPQAEAAALPERGVWRAEARFFNDTQDIWLVSWSVDTASEMLEPPDELIWLEPGASCVDQAAWPVEGEQEQPVWRYTAYRVTADVLHWMDGDWLRPAFANVIVQWVAYDALSPTVQTPLLVGEGAADLFVGGRHVQGTWSRAACDARTLYWDESGREVLLEPGTTWIALFPANASLIFQ